MNSSGESRNYNFKTFHYFCQTLYIRRQCLCIFARLPHGASTCNQTPRNTFLAAGVKIASYWQGELCGVRFRYSYPTQWVACSWERARVSASSGSSHIRRVIKFLSGTLQSGLSAFGSDLQHKITKATLNGKVAFLFDIKYWRKIRTGGFCFIKNLIRPSQVISVITIILFSSNLSRSTLVIFSSRKSQLTSALINVKNFWDLNCIFYKMYIPLWLSPLRWLLKL